jgi:hypothetical protein
MHSEMAHRVAVLCCSACKCNFEAAYISVDSYGVSRFSGTVACSRREASLQ